MNPLITRTGCLLVVIAGCGPSPNDLIESHRADMSGLRERLSALAKELPPPGSVQDSPITTPLQPPFMLKIDDPSSNAAALMSEQLTDNDAHPSLELHLDNSLLAALFWTSPEREGHDYSDGSYDTMQSTLESARQLKYLVVHRVIDVVLPRAVGPQQFLPGHAVIEGMVYELETQQLLGSYRFQVESDRRVEYVARSDQTQEERLEAFAKSELYEKAREQVQLRLQELTGGQISI